MVLLQCMSIAKLAESIVCIAYCHLVSRRHHLVNTHNCS